jgi:hypothetical protein
MANNPPTRTVLKYKGSGNVQVFPNLPTMLNGSQDGSDVGTGGGAGPAGLADLEVPGVGDFASNRTIEFLDDGYCLAMPFGTSTDQGCYKRNEGGAGLWGRVAGHGNNNAAHGSCTGLHVLHPGS